MRDKGRLLFVLALTHKTAPLALREQLMLHAAQPRDFYHTLAAMPHLVEYVILNTCNRFEIYGIAQHPAIQQQLTACLSQCYGVDAATVTQHQLWMTGIAVIRHLFEVCAGIDSQIIGETEVLGQVKVAYAQARERQAVGKQLNRIFQKSFQAVKWVRTHTGIGGGRIGIGNVAVELASRIFGELENSRTLVVGAGEIAERILKALKGRGCESVTITSRTYDRAEKLVHTFGGTVIPFLDVTVLLFLYDIILFCTTAMEPVLSRSALAIALSKRPHRPFFLIDLALPRDVEPQAATLQNVYLYNLDDLTSIADDNLKARKDEIERCRRMLYPKAEHLWHALGLE